MGPSAMPGLTASPKRTMSVRLSVNARETEKRQNGYELNEENPSTRKYAKKNASDLAPSHVRTWVTNREHNDTMRYDCHTSCYDVMNPVGSGLAHRVLVLYSRFLCTATAGQPDRKR